MISCNSLKLRVHVRVTVVVTDVLYNRALQAQTYPWVGGCLVLCENQGVREGRICHFDHSFVSESIAKSDNFSCKLGKPNQ